MAKQESTELIPVSDYAIMQADQADLMDILTMNVGPQGLSQFDLDRIKVPAGGGLQFDIPTLDGEEQASTYEGIIVHWQEPRAYWDVNFDESGGGTPPDCSSPDGVIGEGKFGPDSEGNPSGRCDDCQMSQWGSARGGERRGQACKQMRVLYCVRPDTMLPDVVICPPTSIKNMRKYFLRLAGRQIRFNSVITRFKLERTQSADGITYSRITPSFVARLDDDQAQRAYEYGEAIKRAIGSRVIDLTQEDLGEDID